LHEKSKVSENLTMECRANLEWLDSHPTATKSDFQKRIDKINLLKNTDSRVSQNKLQFHTNPPNEDNCLGSNSAEKHCVLEHLSNETEEKNGIPKQCFETYTPHSESK